MSVMTRVADKAGALGSIVSAMGCGACFPALASLGAALGLGFLSQFEAVFVTVLLPLFAALALLANALGWFSHRQWQRSVLGMIGPAIVLVSSLIFLLAFIFSPQQGLLKTKLIENASLNWRRRAALASSKAGDPR